MKGLRLRADLSDPIPIWWATWLSGVSVGSMLGMGLLRAWEWWG